MTTIKSREEISKLIEDVQRRTKGQGLGSVMELEDGSKWKYIQATDPLPAYYTCWVDQNGHASNSSEGIVAVENGFPAHSIATGDYGYVCIWSPT